MKLVALIMLSAVAVAVSSPFSFSKTKSHSYDETHVQYVNSVYGLLSGYSQPLGSQVFMDGVEASMSGDFTKVAEIAVDLEGFYEITARSFAAKMTSIDETANQEFNDGQALIVGIIRDERDARDILTADYLYRGNRKLPAVSPTNNDHYKQFENNFLSFKRNLVRYKPTVSGEISGLLTTRAWAASHYFEDTNRRPVEYAFRVFMCRDKNFFKTPGLTDEFVRRDITRNQGGDPAEYQKECRSCHSVLDSMSGAFAHFDFIEDQLNYLGTENVATKYAQNPHIYPEGYVTIDDYWMNTTVDNSYFGWRGPTEGYGVKEFGTMFANARAFSSCMVERVYSQICQKELKDTSELEQLTSEFDTSHNLKKLFVRIASSTSCIPQPK